MKWIEPKYSKAQVKKAGKTILSAAIDSSEFTKAIPIFYNWRSSHVFPMQMIYVLLRNNAVKIDKKALVVQRLKRVPSIFLKLMLLPSMSYSRMEDIGGCRAVLSNIRYVYRVTSSLKKSRTKHTLYRERDYIASPKESGYRGIHLIYKYNGGKSIFKGLPVEMQIRSKIQHSWATAVEVVGTFTKQALKSSKGDSDWLEFFKYASLEFSILEGCEIPEKYKGVDTYAKFCELENHIDVMSKLGVFKVAIENLTEKPQSNSAYYILSLEPSKKGIKIYTFKPSELNQATDFYDYLEDKERENPQRDVVLVSAKSLHDLKKAYPNYFLDTAEFQKNVAMVHRSKLT